MAVLTNPTYIAPPGVNYGGVGKAIYHINSFTQATLYFHFKTNISLNSYIMCMIEAVGHCYGNNLPIRCAWCFYGYSTLVNQGVMNTNYNGLAADHVYVAADNSICIRGVGNAYYTGFVLDAYCVNPTGAGHETAITAAVVTASTANQW